MSRRVYLPLVVGDLAALAAGSVPTEVAFGVTEADRAQQPDADEEELEFDAMCAALDAASERRRTKGERRVVVAADVDGGVDAGPLRVGLDRTVGRDRLVSVHVEESPGTPVGEGYDDLLWYDVVELEDLVAAGADDRA